jgi:thioredoxin reductase (NADPH)
VHALIRGHDLSASMSRYLIRRIEETPNITPRRRTRVVALDGREHLESVTWRDETGEEAWRALYRTPTGSAAASRSTRRASCAPASISRT